MSNTEKPRAKKGIAKCPLYKKDMAEVCHDCALWIQVRGKHPQTNEDVDRWDCSFALMPLLAIEAANMQRQTGAAIESFRNVVATHNATTAKMTAAVGNLINHVVNNQHQMAAALSTMSHNKILEIGNGHNHKS